MTAQPPSQQRDAAPEVPPSQPASRAQTPARQLAQLCKQARSLRKNARKALRASGGLGPALRMVLEVFRQDGVLGLRRALALLAAQSETLPTLEADGFDQRDYQAWIRRYDTVDEAVRRRLKKRIAGLGPGPKISVLLLLDPLAEVNTDETAGEELNELLQSVRTQLYPHWELCVAVSSVADTALRDLLEQHAEADQRIRLVTPAQAPAPLAGLAAAANAALAQATGDLVVLLPTEVLLPEQALYCLAQAALKKPGAMVFYSDEDRISATGRRSQPQFKPDFNLELMLAGGLSLDLLACRAELLREPGPGACGLRQGLGSQACFDLAWRVIEGLAPAQIVHIPRVLCHRRVQAEQTAQEMDEEARRSRQVVQEHLERTGQAGLVVPAPGLPARHRVIFERPARDALVSIIIPTRDRADLLGTCIRSILGRTEHASVEIIVLDNGSREEATFRLFESLPKDRVRIVPDAAPFNFSRLNNLGASKASGEYLCLMNNDIEVLSTDWLGEMLSFAAQPEVGCVGARLWYPDNTLQHGGILLGLGGSAGHAHRCLPRGQGGYLGRALLHQSLSAVTAACLLVRRQVFDQVGGLEEQLPESYNDVDFCLRVQRAGYRNVWTPYAELRHYESASRRNRASDYATKMKAYDRQASLLMHTRWGALQDDPAYNPNLTCLGDDFGLAWPPRVVPLPLL